MYLRDLVGHKKHSNSHENQIVIGLTFQFSPFILQGSSEKNVYHFYRGLFIFTLLILSQKSKDTSLARPF